MMVLCLLIYTIFTFLLEMAVFGFHIYLFENDYMKQKMEDYKKANVNEYGNILKAWEEKTITDIYIVPKTEQCNKSKYSEEIVFDVWPGSV